MLESVKRVIGSALARFLLKRTAHYTAISTISEGNLRRFLRPGDVLLVEGDSRISAAIKYLTHSTWSHAAFFVGPDAGPEELIEADLKAGVRYVPLAEYAAFNTRICRPVDLASEDLATIIDFMRASIGKTYDLRNVIDLVRYLLPQPPVPQRWRRRMLALGSGDPTRAICSTLIAEAFQAVRYPILPRITSGCGEDFAEEIYRIRHHSLFTPRDFDLSPFFRIVKPTIARGFDYRAIVWDDAPAPEPPGPGRRAALRIDDEPPAVSDRRR